MSLSGLCTSFSKVTMFSLPEVFCGPQICQKCVGGRGSAPNPLVELTALPQTSYIRLGRGMPPRHSPPYSAPSAPRFSRLRRSILGRRRTETTHQQRVGSSESRGYRTCCWRVASASAACIRAEGGHFEYML